MIHKIRVVIAVVGVIIVKIISLLIITAAVDIKE